MCVNTYIINMNLSLFSNSLQVVSQVPCPLRLPDNHLYFSTNPPQLVYLFFKSYYIIFYSFFSTSLNLSPGKR